MNDGLAFRGFSADGLRFLGELAAHNDRGWFAANKQRYERGVAQPMRAFVADATRALARAGVPIGGDEKRSIFRIYRDVRFARDKSPYRTHAACYLSYDGGRATQGGLYLHVEPGRSYLSVPFYLVPAPMLRRWRASMRDDPQRFVRVVRALAKKGLAIDGPDGSEDALRRMPRGFGDMEDAELAPYFLLRSFCVGRELTRAEVTSPRLLQVAVRLVRDAKPLLDYGWSMD
jgi:uncharacterized protein (TIGR02453 family)